MSFETGALVRFAHVDPAGIVFYPRYFEMLNGAVEDWFDQSLGVSFRDLHLDQGIGTPTVKLEVTFLSPSRLGDDLIIRITPRAVGQSSCTIDVLFTAEGRDRLQAQVVLGRQLAGLRQHGHERLRGVLVPHGPGLLVDAAAGRLVGVHSIS